MAKRKFRAPPQNWGGGDANEAIRKVVLPVTAGLLRGKANNTYDVTLTALATTTTLATEIATADSIAFLTPKTASAAVAIGAGVLYSSCADNGVVTITHDVSAATDRTFGVAVLG